MTSSCSAVSKPPGNLDALHVAGVIELVVQAVGEPDGAPGIGGDLAAQIACQPIGMAGERFTMLLRWVA